MSARAWRARKGSHTHRAERAWRKAERRAARNPGQPVLVRGYTTTLWLIVDEAGRMGLR